MKKIIGFLFFAVAVFNVAHAGNGASCATILCLGGEMGGAMGGEMCDKPIQDYFDIKKYRGAEYAPDLTLEARIDYLDECPEDTTTKMRINAKYGMLPDNPFPKG